MSVLDQIKQILQDLEGLRPEDIKLTHNLVADFGFDDLELVEFNVHIEEKFGIRIPDEETNLHTVEDFVNYVTNHQKAP